ncbi:MAG: DUF4139 domain-containing protein [Bacteroidales bacterium]|jgi:uncharacterized protein (TIGR02231 family)|nr:DUF4139 domain-containing protein [Bacteroidales bacterium]
MKKSILFAIVLLFVTFQKLQAQEKVVPVASTISNVTIFLSGAEIQREGTIAIQAGAQQLIFDNLPSDINPKSIQVAGVGKFTILGISSRIDYLKPAEKTKEVADLKKALNVLNEKITLQQYTLNNLTAEETMLKQNQAIGGSETGVKIADLKEFADFFRTRLSDITKLKIETQTKLDEMTKEREAINNQLKSLQSNNAEKPTGTIVVDITAPAAGQAKLTVTYLVINAGWTPSYDLRSADINKPVEVTYKANVYQATGENWNNIKPVFSTANPTINSTKPTLHPWYLSFYQPAPISNYQSFNLAEVAIDRKAITDDEVMASPAFTTGRSTTVQENQTSIEFIVDVPYTIPSGGETHAVELAKYSLPAVYEYFAVRKLEKDVFLLGKVTGWEKLNLLSGPANVFFEGKYVGETSIETRQTDDTLAISLGRDKNITVTRIRKKDYTEKQLLGGNVTETREWDLTVHNKKSQTITITIEDQVPISTEKEIKVEVLNISEAIKDANTGKLTWKLPLKPTETRSMNVKYSVKYPKDKTVVLE